MWGPRDSYAKKNEDNNYCANLNWCTIVNSYCQYSRPFDCVVGRIDNLSRQLFLIIKFPRWIVSWDFRNKLDLHLDYVVRDF